METCSQEAEAREGGEVTVDTGLIMIRFPSLPCPPHCPLPPPCLHSTSLLASWAHEPLSRESPPGHLKAQGSQSLHRAYPCYGDCPLCQFGNSQAVPSYRWSIRWAVGDLPLGSGSEGGEGGAAWLCFSFVWIYIPISHDDASQTFCVLVGKGIKQLYTLHLVYLW